MLIGIAKWLAANPGWGLWCACVAYVLRAKFDLILTKTLSTIEKLVETLVGSVVSMIFTLLLLLLAVFSLLALAPDAVKENQIITLCVALVLSVTYFVQHFGVVTLPDQTIPLPPCAGWEWKTTKTFQCEYGKFAVRTSYDYDVPHPKLPKTKLKVSVTVYNDWFFTNTWVVTAKEVQPGETFVDPIWLWLRGATLFVACVLVTSHLAGKMLPHSMLNWNQLATGVAAVTSSAVHWYYFERKST